MSSAVIGGADSIVYELTTLCVGHVSCLACPRQRPTLQVHKLVPADAVLCTLFTFRRYAAVKKKTKKKPLIVV